MSHTITDKKKLINRVRRIRGQIEGIEKALRDEKDCSLVLQDIAACRGAINGLMSEVLEGHIKLHLLDPDTSLNSERLEAAEVLIELIRTYLR
ncbi:MAG: metal/formaldehyde-sensitive transcriptional repressor [Thermodesulfobacteriota bacterium]